MVPARSNDTPDAAPGAHTTRGEDGTPRHVAVILDGNRRWARIRGEHPAEGHRVGLAKIPDFLGWCEAAGLEYVTLWLLSPDNLSRRRDELEPLFATLEDVVRRLARTGRWPLRHLGDPAILPPALADALSEAERAAGDPSAMTVNLAVGYGGREDILHAIGELLADGTPSGDAVTEEAVADRLSTRGQPDPALVVRTSGEQRLSGFMSWQAATAELYFTPVLWPDFDETDLAEALASFARRQRRRGS